MTADAAVQGIRELDSEGTIAIISSEPDPPYDRPPLTKGLWKGKPVGSIWREAAKKSSQLHLNRRAQSLDLSRRQVLDNQGDIFTFEKLLLATGGQPRRLPFGGDQIIYYRTFRDYERLKDLVERDATFAVLGGGFIGSELAAALALNGKKVTLIFPGAAIGSRIFPRELSLHLNDYYRERGVSVLPGEQVCQCERKNGQWLVQTQSGKQFAVNAVIAGLGIEPDVGLAANAGLRVENGIVVDEFLRTSHPEVYSAGDASAFYNPALRRRIRVEHEDNANTMGRQAGRNMAGAAERYLHLPFFYSDLFDLGYEAVGDTDSRLTVLTAWKEPFREGIVYYQHQGQVRGVLLWNVWGKVDAARQLIASNRHFRPEELKPELLEAA